MTTIYFVSKSSNETDLKNELITQEQNLMEQKPEVKDEPTMEEPSAQKKNFQLEETLLEAKKLYGTPKDEIDEILFELNAIADIEGESSLKENNEIEEAQTIDADSYLKIYEESNL